MTLGSNERLLKVYNYGSVSAKDGNDTQPEGYSLTVTNKRIIISEDTQRGKCATEIRTCDIKAVSYGIKIMRNTVFMSLLSTFFALAAVLMALAFTVGATTESLKTPFIVVAVILFVLGIVFLILWLLKKESAFYLLFFVTEEYHVAAQVVAVNNKLKFDKLENNCIEVYMSVNASVAQHMVEEIGSLIVDCQAGKA